MDSWLMEGLQAIGRFFMHPVLYVFVAASLLAGYWRIKQERRDFSFKVHDMWYELKTSLFAGIGPGVLISIITISAGVMFSKASLFFIASWTVLFALLLQFRYLSAAYSIGAAIFVFMFSPSITTGYAPLDAWLSDGADTSLTALALVMALLLAAEGLFLFKHAAVTTTPRLQKGKRGLLIGSHFVKRMWVVPVCVLIPGDAITSVFSWWPVLSVNAQTFSLFLVPFGLGFTKSVKGMLPRACIAFTGRRVLALSALVLLLALVSIWLPGTAVAAAGAAILGRITIAIREQLDDESRPPFFSSKTGGLMILDTLPNSAAEQMGLQQGEIITKVNGMIAETHRDFYESLQRNTAGAQCKLEVLDTNGEIRLVQRVLFAGEHHELGIIFVQRDYGWDTEAV